ncbi:MAG: glycosyltransferase family 4 protein [Clostridia bacterium]|nr:glycosyltransferase family 4 protein [Clostridia bacterium]
MNIAVVGAADSPHVIKWVNALAGSGNTVFLYSMPNQKDERGEIHRNVEVVYLAYPEAAGGIKKDAPELRSFIAKEDFQAVAVFDILTYGVMAQRAKLDHVLLVSTGVDVMNGMKAGQKKLLASVIADADAVCATAANVITRMKEICKKDQQYFVTPFGVDMELFRPMKIPRPNAFTFGSLKSLEYYDHVDYVIEAYAKFCEQTGMPSLLRVVGGGPALPDLRALVERLGIADKVEFLGWVRNADMPGVINTLDVVVQMPDEECLGISAIEAMACEVPVISSDTDGASEYILNGVTGFLVKTGNVDRCASKMLELANEKELRESMGFHARQDVMDQYSLQDCLKKFETALQAAAGMRVR